MKSFLRAFGLFSDEEIDAFLDKGRSKKLRKGDTLLREGTVCHEVSFIQSGFFRSFYYNSQGEEVTHCFSFAQSLIADYASFVTQQTAKETIEAMTAAEVLTFKRSDLLEMEANPNWLRFFKLLAEGEFVRLEARFFSQMKESAESRYLKLVSENPEYLRLIPLNHLASYLGITQRHLTRIRKKLQ